MTDKSNRSKRLSRLFITGILLGASHSAWSAAFQLQEQSARWLGTAYAGAASAAEDASTGYYNPAGLTRLGQEQIALSGVLVNSDTKLNVNTATIAAFNLGSGTVRSRNVRVVPGLHYARKLSDNWMVGFNVASPFGLKALYNTSSIARYTTTRFELMTTDISPSLAYRFDNGLALGAGVDALYASAKLDRNRLALSPSPNNDFFTHNAVRNWGMGYHAGVLLELGENSRLGVNYRSKVKVRLRGDTLGTSNSGVLVRSVSVRTDFTFPETLTVSGYHDLNEQWALMGDIQWTHWSRYQQLTLSFSDGTQNVYPQAYKNSIRVAVGATYQYDDCWKFKLGTAYDKTPTRDALRRISVPDQNRTWGSLGAQYRFTKNLALDVGYAHLFFKKATINDPAPIVIGAGALGQSLQGTSRTSVDLVGIQLTWDLI